MSRLKSKSSSALPRFSFTGLLSSRAIIIALVIPVLFVCSCSQRSLQIKRAERFYQQGQTYLAKGQYEKALDKFENSLALARKIEFKSGAAHNLNEIGIIQIKKGEYAKAREYFYEAVSIYEQLEMDPEISKSLNNIALSYVTAKAFDQALQSYAKLLAWDEKTGNSLGMAITANNMGHIFEQYYGDYTEAEKKYLQALKIFDKLGKERLAQSVKEKLERLKSN